MADVHPVLVGGLDPEEQIPFSTGWRSVIEAALGLLRPVRPVVFGYCALFLLFAVVRDLTPFLWEFDVPDAIRAAYQGVAITLALALASHLMVAGLIGERPSLAGALRACVRTRGSLVILALFNIGVLSLSLTFFPWTFMLVAAWLLGPPMLLQTIVIEGPKLTDAARRTYARMDRHGSSPIFESFLLGGLASFLRGVVVYEVGPRLADLAGGPKAIAGLLTDSILWGLATGLFFAFVSALWLVAYINSRSLTDGTGTSELRVDWHSSRVV